MAFINLTFPTNSERATFGEIARVGAADRGAQEAVLDALIRAVWQGILFVTLEMPGLGSITPPVLARWAQAGFGWPPLDATGAPVNFPQESTDDEAALRKALEAFGIADFSDSAVRQLRSLSVSRLEFEERLAEISALLSADPQSIAASTNRRRPRQRDKTELERELERVWHLLGESNQPRSLKDVLAACNRQIVRDKPGGNLEYLEGARWRTVTHKRAGNLLADIKNNILH